jgi:selenocysteine lyase/cysteine desulfurase
MITRRGFLRRAALGSAVLHVPLARAEAILRDEPPPLPPVELLKADPARYWADLRRQWLLAPDHINLNCGSVGCSPWPVLRAVVDHLLSSETFRDPGYPWFGYEENALLRRLRTDLASFLGCKLDELALVRNATEGNNVVCNGLDLNPGDEVVLTDQEHPGGRCCWEQKAARHGIQLRWAKLPRPPARAEEVIEAVTGVLTPKTRVLAISHITTVTGLVLPVKELCAVARQRGILSHLDGAHAVGQIPLDVHDLGCDFYVTSPHKWLLAPKGTGLLYIREELLDRLWVNIASAQWKSYDQKAYRFSNLGTSNLSVMAGLQAALDFHKQLGPAMVYQRIHELAAKVRDRLAGGGRVKVTTSAEDKLYGGLVSFEPVKGDLQNVLKACAARKIRVAGTKERIRIATHVFTQRRELETFFEAVDEASLP